MRKSTVMLMVVVVVVVPVITGCTNTLRGVGCVMSGVGELGKGMGQDIVNAADDNDLGTYNRISGVMR